MFGYISNYYLEKIERKNGYNELYVENIDELTELIRPDKPKRIKDLFNQIYLNTIEKDGVLKLYFNNFLYRGISDSNHDLSPTLFRIEQYKELNHKDFIRKEFNILKKFIESCDFANTQIPNDSFKLREIFKNENKFLTTYFSENEGTLSEDLYELAAFAQHYGVPTRLLDWSYHPLVSLYFASIGAIKSFTRTKKNAYFSLWVYSPITHVNPHDQKILDHKIKIIDVPRAINQHVSFQQGCFIMVEQANNDNNFDFLSKDSNEDSSENINLNNIIEDPKFLRLNDLLHKFDLNSNLLKIN
ncbi:TPA: FRG domain-containing protein, partial [Acinetobacter baumannii]